MSEKPISISIQFDKPKKSFRLTAPVFSGDAVVPKAIAAYLASLPSRGACLSIEEDKIFFEEEVSCCWGPQPTLRQKLYEFLRRAKRCSHHLRCAALEEKLGDAQSFLDLEL